MEKKELTIIEEGSAEFYVHAVDKDSIPSKSMNVFYNKKMEINRDISSLAIIAYKKLYNQKELIIVDSMAASGISSIRMLKECENIKKIYINDLNPIAVDLIRKNLILNNLNKNSAQIEVSKKDANLLFSEIEQKSCPYSEGNESKPNIISIDPFGTPNIYIDSAFKALQRNNGLLCITATDTAVLFGVRPNACIRKYMSKPLHTEYCKEIGARILIYFISRLANVNKIGIIPLLTFYSNHFIRVFCLTLKDKKKISELFKSYGYIVHCNRCGYRSSFQNNLLELSLECPICKDNGRIDYAGPLWVDEIHDENFVKELIVLNENFEYKNKKKLNKLLNFIKDEISTPISYYNVHKLCQILKIPIVPKIDLIINYLKTKGFLASRTHFDYLSIKTNASIKYLKESLLEL
ncbi:MAG: tRNA (guanine(10)-N(2))-dimethyltransferase [Promethearchaeota archaeon]